MDVDARTVESRLMALDAKLPPRPVLWAVFAAIVVLACANLGSRDLLHPDEGRYARDRARDGGDRRLGDAAPERPQVFREAAAAILGHGGARIRAFGVHEWTARLWPALAGFLAVARDRRRRVRARRVRRSARSRRSRSPARCGTPASRRSSRSIPGSRSFSRLGSPRSSIAQRARTQRRVARAHGCGSPGRRWPARRCRRA